ncbi:hypothetical protein [Rhizobium arsenicireducens]
MKTGRFTNSKPEMQELGGARRSAAITGLAALDFSSLELRAMVHHEEYLAVARAIGVEPLDALKVLKEEHSAAMRVPEKINIYERARRRLTSR